MTFQEALEFEKSQQYIADNLYIRQFCSKEDIFRCDWKQYKSLQESGIDVKLFMRTPNGQGKHWINISEKFRSTDFDDICIELYSNETKPGWGITDKDVDFYMIFHPDINKDRYGQAEMISYNVIHELAREFKTEFDYAPWKNQFLESKHTSKVIDINGMVVTFIRPHTHTSDGGWDGVCVCIPKYEVKNRAHQMGLLYTEYLTVLDK